MTLKITIDGAEYAVKHKLGYQPSIGAYAYEVTTPSGPRMVIKTGWGSYRFWTVQDRAAPLISAIAKGWPKEDQAIE